ncbi:protein arginine kinase [Lysinibacillus sp. NPDC048646]|uniref:protein arginine kinase n=1 Tax=Lysinibacillus sp. NPDC048646 TaxID=3390574 RepID=UPI003D01AEC8
MMIEPFLESATPVWMHIEDDYSDIVISTRIRLARNLDGYRFPLVFSEDEALQVEQAVTHAIQDSPKLLERYSYFAIKDLTPLQRQILVEKHLISPQLAKKELVGSMLLSEDESISIMVNEEDHLRIQCMTASFQLQKAYEQANKIDRALEGALPYAFRDDFGYLTSCPTNIGSGLRASVMMHLPVLTLTGQMNQIINAMTRLGMTVRGIYGEGSENLGNVYQVSNQITLGKTEDDILADIQSVAEKIIQKERQARGKLMDKAELALEDRIYRALGTLTHARILTSEEAATCLSNVRLGVDLQLIDGIKAATLNECIVCMQPGFLQHYAGEALPPSERDRVRAKMLREALFQETLSKPTIGGKGEDSYDV